MSQSSQHVPCSVCITTDQCFKQVLTHAVQWGLTSRLMRSALWKHTDDNQTHTCTHKSLTTVHPFNSQEQPGLCFLARAHLPTLTWLQTSLHFCSWSALSVSLLSLTCAHPLILLVFFACCLLCVSVYLIPGQTFISGTLAGTCRDSPLSSPTACGTGLTN